MKKAYQLKIQLKNFKPSNYRTILVDPNKDLKVLHNYILQLFGFYGYHLAEFIDNKLDFHYFLTEEDIAEIGLFEGNADLMENVKLKNVFSSVKKRLTYTYDFGDNWSFDVIFEKEIETNENLPKILRGKGGFLIEDIGGPWRLSRLIDLYKNNKITELKEELYLENCDDFENEEEKEMCEEEFEVWIEKLNSIVEGGEELWKDIELEDNFGDLF